MIHTPEPITEKPHAELAAKQLIEVDGRRRSIEAYLKQRFGLDVRTASVPRPCRGSKRSGSSKPQFMTLGQWTAVVNSARPARD